MRDSGFSTGPQVEAEPVVEPGVDQGQASIDRSARQILDLAFDLLAAGRRGGAGGVPKEGPEEGR